MIQSNTGTAKAEQISESHSLPPSVSEEQRALKLAYIFSAGITEGQQITDLLPAPAFSLNSDPLENSQRDTYKQHAQLKLRRAM